MAPFSRVKYQFLATVIGNTLMLGQGTNAGWYSPSLPHLRSPDSPLLDGALSTEMAGWIGSMVSVGSLFGVLSFGTLALWTGFKRCLQLATIPLVVSWLLIILGHYSCYLMFSRFLTGVSIGAGYVCMPQFVAEMSSDHVRGQLNSYMQTFCFSGILLGFIGASYLPMLVNPCLMLTLPVIFSIGFCFMPDTPQQLIRNNKYKAAEKSLRFYRNCKPGGSDAQHEQEVRDELDKLLAIAKQAESDTPLRFSDFLTPIAWRTMLICPTLMAVNQFSGSFAISMYAVTVFQCTRSTIDAQVSSIAMALLQVFGTYTAAVLIDRTGRKLLLLVSTLGGFVMLMITGIYALLLDLEYDLGAWDWVPVVSISSFIFIGSIGILPVPYVMLAEVLPPKIRRVGAICCSCFVYVCQSTVLKIMPTLLERMHLFGCMFLFAGVIFAGFLFTVLVVTETKGISLEVLESSESSDAEAGRQPKDAQFVAATNMS